MASSSQYYVTEAQVASLFESSGLPDVFKDQFTRDYVAIKRDIGDSSDDIAALKIRVTNVEIDLDTAESNIVILTTNLGVVTVNLSTLTTNFNAHTSATAAHGSTGNIVGTDNYCSAVLGGTVLKAAAVAAASASAVNMAITPNAAGVGYVQADATTWVNAINEHKAGINQLKTDFNALITLFNSSLTTETTAKQRA